VEPAVNNKEAGLLVINAIEETWIRIKADQNPSFQILLKVGEKFERKAASFDMDIATPVGLRYNLKVKIWKTWASRGRWSTCDYHNF